MAALAANGDHPTSLNGSGADADVLPKIHDALRLVYNPHSTNQARHEAQLFLEKVKTIATAPSIGFDLASQPTHEPIVRHYGLSLLEDAIKHKWARYTADQAAYLRSWVLQLAEKVSMGDPLFLRNKVALLWVEVAKRCWAAEWMDMDDMLMSLWRIPGPTVHKELVLYILETLSDEVFIGDDPVVILPQLGLAPGRLVAPAPAPGVAEPEGRQDVQGGGGVRAVDHRDPDQQVGRRRLGRRGAHSTGLPAPDDPPISR